MAKLKVKETLNGYEVTVGEYKTNIRVGEEIGGVTPMKIEVSRQGVRIAGGDSSIRERGKTLVFGSLTSIPLSDDEGGLKALSALVFSVEEALRGKGVETAKCRTSSSLARVLGQMGYTEAKVSGDVVDVVKNLQTQEPKLPQLWELGGKD